MRYLILIYVDPATYEGVSEAESEEEMGSGWKGYKREPGGCNLVRVNRRKA